MLQLKLPQEDADGDVSTVNVAPLILTFQNQTLQSLNHGACVINVGDEELGTRIADVAVRLVASVIRSQVARPHELCVEHA